ncbi:DUF4097 family beta strand repeat-containing protein [Nonomuraea roseola]|uniref:DUF4097 domain-containing protein n=1 Tax=Nonomuraea roseola TaxID=46179 RepID=A0ABV5PX72_9ACTN
MPAFDTPEPISAVIEIWAGTVRIRAGDRTDTVVEVRPRDASDDADIRAAEQTKVEYAGGRLLVKSPRSRSHLLLGWGGSIEVTLDLPTGSKVDADAAADFRCQGRLGACSLTTASGDIMLDETGKLRLSTADGDISVRRAVGHLDVTTSNGEIDIREIDGTAVLKTSNGNIRLGQITGDLRLRTAYGDITVGRALESAAAKTAYGSVSIGEVVRGAVVLDSGGGDLEVGVRQGTAAWLDLDSHYGSIDVPLTAAHDGPRQAEETVEVRARTRYGDILVRRS